MNQFPNFQTKKEYDLEERTANLAEKVIDMAKKIPKGPINNPLIEQIIRSSGSIGANYCEASESESKKDFVHKIGIAKKETKETKHWLRLLARASVENQEELRVIWKETQELLLIFSKIITSSKN